MKNIALQFFTDREWVTFALLIFFIFFTTLVYRVLGTRAGKEMEDRKWLLFDNGDKDERRQK